MPPEIQTIVGSYWGKALPAREDGPRWHPLAYHCLDVAACASVITARHPQFAGRVSALGGDEAVAWMPVIAALHDLGKFSFTFQNKAPELFARLQPGNRGGRAGRVLPHADLGALLWRTVLVPRLDLWDEAEFSLEVILAAAFGHHGRPPRAGDDLALTWNASNADQEAACLFAEAAIDLLGPGTPLADSVFATLSEDAAARLSWLVSGLVNAADWIGSNQDYFPYEAPRRDLESYWRAVALPRAEDAVADSGVVPRRPLAHADFHALFPKIDTPRPLQRLADTIDLPDGQALVMVEDVTGSGKTEAADVLAARMMAAGRGSGIYFALPTMVTADAIAERHTAMYHAFFDAGETPSLTLVHGGVDEAAREVLDQGGAECRAWMAGDRRRQLAAEVAVGTIDQALLAALPAKFATMRLFGLATKILIVDEVHAYDAYTGMLLEGLLRMHAALGGSAILLSATLAGETKTRLARAFAEGAGWRDLDLSALASRAYPCLTLTGAGSVTANAVAALENARRDIPVAFTTSEEAVMEDLLAKVRAGDCAVWLRNTVDDAIEAYEALSAQHDDVTLLHARFARADRRRLEAEVLRRFDRHSRAEDRAGGLVIATQVLEQSLDLDFDHMAVDLKPIDGLIQSAGRLRRHRRDRDGDRLPNEDSADARESTPLTILSPDLEADCDGDWYRRLFPRAAAVYQRVDHLWLTAKELTERGAIRQPDELRELIEGVFGPEPRHEVPEAIEEASTRPEGAALADRSFAQMNQLRPEQGYSTGGGQWADDRRAPTRLGDTVEVCLLRADDRGLHPWASEGLAAEPDFTTGFLRLRPSQLPDGVERLREAEPIASLIKNTPALKYRLPIALSQNGDAWATTLTGQSGAQITLTYTPDKGLTIHRETTD